MAVCEAGGGTDCSGYCNGNYVWGLRTLPDNAIVRRSAQNLRCSNRLGHEWELIMPTTRLEAVQSSSLNTAKKIWNALLTRIVAIGHHESFKSAVKDPAVYHYLIKQNAVRNVELAV
uniref:Uncharacterized protein n=1 Tax=Acrobeloides nanus TaxID=290746 RepID=A0A914E160_9BILA